jgi:hypothetical protein
MPMRIFSPSVVLLACGCQYTVSPVNQDGAGTKAENPRLLFPLPTIAAVTCDAHRAAPLAAHLVGRIVLLP